MAAAIRIYGALNELWLDEILALVAARNVVSILDIFTTIHSEINHHLYTVYLYLVNPQGNWLLCRTPSLLAGIGTMGIAGLIGRRRSSADAFFSMFLIGFSYVMVLYSSEMRGYAMAVFFSFLSFYLLDSYLALRKWQTSLFFSLCVVLGIVSQLTFLSFYMAALVWSVYRLVKSHSGLRQLIFELLSIHAIPLMFLTAFYFVNIRYMTGIGGTSSPSLIYSFGTALAWSMGAPPSDFMKMLTCIAAVVVLNAGIQLLWREKSDSFIFFLGAILVFPIILITIRGSDEIYVRYYIISIAFLLLLCSYLLAQLYYQGLRGKTICTVLLAGYMIANGSHMISLFKYGRGQYSEAIRFITQRSNTSPVTVASDQDFRTSLIWQFYAQEAMGQKKAIYYEQGHWPQTGPDWVIYQKESLDAPTPIVTEAKDQAGNKYEFVKTFPSAPLSGLHWFIYKNQSKDMSGQY
jgi:hypothetical protein